MGGKGSSVMNVTEETRIKISKARRGNLNDLNEMMNITSLHRKKVLVGYVVKRDYNGKTIRKQFASSKNTPTQNLELAKKWIMDFKNKTLVNNPRNKESQLPINISYARRNNNIVGYVVRLKANKKIHYRGFCDTKESMETKLNKAIQYRDNILKQVKTVEQAGKPVQDNPQPKP